MIVVNIIGGLGNQMFQYAFAYTLSKKNKTQLKLDISGFESYDLRQYLLDLFCINGEIATYEEINQLKYKKESLFAKFFRKLTRQPKPFSNAYYKESAFQLDKPLTDRIENVYFEGYWQSEKYFQSYRNDLLKFFTLRNPIHAKSKQYQKKILASRSVSLHIRRGDYVSNAHTNSVHGTCKLSYYQKAISYLEDRVKKPHFFIFSDDLTWAKQNLDFIKYGTFIELEQNIPDHEEMYLMSQCQHNIIANSSFSWWGAWLNQNEDKNVVAPLRWFTDATINTDDLIPEAWTRI